MTMAGGRAPLVNSLLIWTAAVGIGALYCELPAATGAQPKQGSTFLVTVTGGVRAVTNPVEVTTKGITRTQLPVDLELDLSFLKTAIEGGKKCFEADTHKSILAIGELPDGSAHVQFDFNVAEADKGPTVAYLLELLGAFDDRSNWPPRADKPTSTITLNRWELLAIGRGPCSKQMPAKGDLPETRIVVERVAK